MLVRIIERIPQQPHIRGLQGTKSRLEVRIAQPVDRSGTTSALLERGGLARHVDDDDVLDACVREPAVHSETGVDLAEKTKVRVGCLVGQAFFEYVDGGGEQKLKFEWIALVWGKEGDVQGVILCMGKHVNTLCLRVGEFNGRYA